MSRFEAQVFTEKLAALKFCREEEKEGAVYFAEVEIPAPDAKLPSIALSEVYVVAVSEHAAKQALLDFLMPLKKWAKADRDSQYIEALEEAAKVNGPVSEE